MSRPTRALAGVGAGGVAAWAVDHRRRAIAEVAPELRDPSMWVPFSITSRPALAVSRRLFDTPSEPVAGVRVERRTATAGDGAEIGLFLYQPPNRPAPGPVLLWIHGGGTIQGTAAADHRWASGLARDLGALVASVDYRLAPEHPFPTGPEDCYAVLRWLQEHSAALGIDAARIAVGGASAGGLLAASVAQLAQDRRDTPPLAFQLLVFPMLDDRTGSGGDGPRHRGRTFFGWTPASNRWAWRAYLGQAPGAQEPSPYAVPARREDLAGLAPAWIGVGDLDLFHDEDVAYAERLRAAGVPCELVVEPRMHHGPDLARWESIPSMADFRHRMLEALRTALLS